MTKAPINLQDLRRRLYIKAKAEASWRFWGLYVHVCKRETLQEAYLLARANDGAPGMDGVTFETVEAEGVEEFLDQLRKELGWVHQHSESLHLTERFHRRAFGHLDWEMTFDHPEQFVRFYRFAVAVLN